MPYVVMSSVKVFKDVKNLPVLNTDSHQEAKDRVKQLQSCLPLVIADLSNSKLFVKDYKENSHVKKLLELDPNMKVLFEDNFYKWALTCRTMTPSSYYYIGFEGHKNVCNSI